MNGLKAAVMMAPHIQNSVICAAQFIYKSINTVTAQSNTRKTL